MTSLLKFNYHCPTAIHFGEGATADIHTLVPLGARVLLLYGGGSIMKNGAHARTVQALSGRFVAEFSGVEPNPGYDTLMRAAQRVREQKLDFVLAVGGGSVADGAKFVAIAALDDGDAWELVKGVRPIVRALPVGVVLTLAATGSESNPTSVISRYDTGEKIAFHSPHMCPRFAVLEPGFLLSLPDRQLANGLVDAFVHVCEQYLTYPAGALVQDGYAEAVMRALLRLSDDFENRRHLTWCQNLMWAANQALSGIVGVGVPQDWATHAIGLQLTARYAIDHARTLSIIQPALLRETLAEKNLKLLQLGRNVFGVDAVSAEQVIGLIESMYVCLGLPVHLREAEIDDRDAVRGVMLALEGDGPRRLGENGILTRERVKRIVEAACT